jgi:hypothetical protein
MGGHSGTAESAYYNDVWESSDDGATWKELPTAPWKPRSYHTAKVFNDTIYLLGGHDNATWYNDVWSTKDGSNWEQVTAQAQWSPRAACAFQIRRGQMFVMGGSDGLLPPIGNGTVRNDVWTSEDQGRNWELATFSAPWPAREGLQKLTALYGADDLIVLTSGEAGYTGPYYNDVWGTVDGRVWTLVNPAADFSKRSGNLLLQVGGGLFTFGGYGFPMKHDGYCLPAGDAGGAWRKLGSAPWHGRFDYDMVATANGSIVLLGGEASLFGTGGPYFNDVWMLPNPACPPT